MPGTCSKCGTCINSIKKRTNENGCNEDLYMPMHPDVKSDSAGNCPKCGMKLTQAKPAKN
jgi:hypothetical protein